LFTIKPVPPMSAALQRIAEIAGPLATVDRVHALPGGTHARTHLVQTANPELDVVLREFPPGDDAGEREARVLTALDGLGGLAPRLLASDVDGTWSGRPAVVISRLPGHAHVTPADPRDWAAQLGEALARIHAANLQRATGFERVFDRTGGSQGKLSGPAAARVGADWEGIRSAPTVLTPYDYWSGNVLWQGAVLSGVVDWSGAALGPAGFDLGWCRMDLYLLYDEHVAGAFLASYETATGSAVRDRSLWDLWAVARSHRDVEEWVENYQGVGRPDLTAAELRRRHSAWTELAARD